MDGRAEPTTALSQCFLATDLQLIAVAPVSLRRRFRVKLLEVATFAHWERLDRHEIALGASLTRKAVIRATLDLGSGESAPHFEIDEAGSVRLLKLSITVVSTRRHGPTGKPPP